MLSSGAGTSHPGVPAGQEPWWARFVLAECLHNQLTPLQAAAFALHLEVAVPALAALGAEPVAAAQLVACPLRPAAGGVTATPAPAGTALGGAALDCAALDGVLLDGGSGPYPLSDGGRTALVPLAPRPGADPGLRTTALIALDQPRVSVRPAGPGLADLRLTGLAVPGDQLLPIRPEWPLAAEVWIAVHRVATAQGLLADAHRHATSRSSLGAPLWEHQWVKFGIAQSVAQVDGVRQLVRHAARQAGLGRCAPELAAAAGLRSARLLNTVSAHCLQLRGASGHVQARRLQEVLMESRLLTAASQVEGRARDTFAALAAANTAAAAAVAAANAANTVNAGGR
ncbi:acyl-CoA/acyl-ACP dehydrogenase [Streptacidiphilus sp. 4-A2]|nr:acyl-CoA/acyl-ACP dehydrogenase [Streptacidiphilus sp. 4-A2]